MAGRVSFLIAAFNEEKYIEECVNSCLNQEGSNVEVCVVDDGSLDHTLEVLDRFADDSRVRVKALCRNSGKVAAFNAAYELATGEYIALLGGDDVNTPDRIRRSLECMRTLNADLVYGDYFVCDAALHPKSVKVVKVVPSAEKLIFNNKLSGGTFFFRRNVADAVFPIPAKLRFEDWWIGFVALSKFNVKKVDAPLIYYRHHGANDSLAKRGESLKSRDFARHDEYYNAFLDYVRECGNGVGGLERALEEARFFKLAYLGQNVQARIATALKFFGKFRFPQTKIGWLGMLLIVPFGSSVFDFALRMSARRQTQEIDCASGGRVSILGVQFDNLTMRGLVDAVDAALMDGGRRVLALSNPEFLVAANNNPFLRRYLNEIVDINVADGVGVLWAANLYGMPLRERVTGTDFVPELYKLAVARGYRIFFLGGKPGVAERARNTLRTRYGVDVVAGCRDGYFGEAQESSIVREINDSGADALMVCLGNPKQEEWIARHLDELAPRVVFGNGGALDFWAGEVKRAPRWVQSMGMEWLYRLGQDLTWTRLRRQSRLFTFVYLVIGKWLAKRDFA